MHWLYNEGLIVFLFIKLLSEVIHLLRKNPSLWEEIVFIWENFSHAHQVAAEVVLSSKLVHPWVVVDTLMRLQFG